MSTGPCYIDSNRTCNFLDCGDSPLSLSGNIISVLTFVIAALVTYLAFFQDVRDIPQSADDYSNDIRVLHDQLWTIGDIHGQLAKLVASNSVRISNVHLQSRLQQGQSESLKEARKFLDDYSASYQDVFTNYFKRHRWVVRLKWLLLQQKVARYKKEASELRNAMSLDLLAITVNMSIALQQSLQERDAQNEKLSRKLDDLFKLMGGSSMPDQDRFQRWNRSDSPSPSIMIDPVSDLPPTILISPPDDEPAQSPSRSPSPFSSRKPLERSASE